MDKLVAGLRGSSPGTTTKDPAKKLKEFYDPKSTQVKKFKSLVGYCESAGSTEEVKTLFEKDASYVWSVFLDTFQYFEQKATTKENKDYRDIEKLLLILKRILVYLPQKIKEKWQIRSISNILEKILYKENKIEIRLQGLELLLLFFEDLEAPEVNQQNIFAAGIDLEVFETRYTSKKIILPKKILSAQDSNIILAPATNPPKVEDAVAMIDLVLDFMVQHENSFGLFWGLFKQHYITLFYPDVCKEVGILDRFSDIGFPGFCPPEIQSIFISKLGGLLDVNSIAKALWTSQEDTSILMEIFRQSCLLPMEYVETIKHSVTLYRRLFLGTTQQPIPKVLQDQTDRLPTLQRFYIEQLPNIFKTETKAISAEEHATVCLEIFELFKQSFEMLDTLSQEIRDVLLFTLLEITTALLKPDNPNQELAKSVAGVMIDTLLFTWISSRVKNVKMWARLQEGLQAVFYRIEPVIQAKIKLLQLSMIIKDFMYPVDEKKKFKREISPEKAANVVDASVPERKRSVKINADPVIAALKWDFETILFIWNAIFKIFSHMNKIKEPSIHSEAVGCIADVIDIFLNAEAKASVQKLSSTPESSQLPLLQTFGQYLFEACTLHDKYYEGKTKAIGALCRIMCRHYRLFPGIYPENLLPNFYTTIHTALVNPPAHNSNLLPWCVLENSSNIFNLALPGATVLIPYYLIEIKKMLKQQCPIELRKTGITILGSLLAYGSHFQDTIVPMQFYGHMQKAKAKELTDAENTMTYLEIKDRIMEIITGELRETKDSELLAMCLNSLALLLCDNFISTPLGKNLSEIAKLIMGFTGHADWNISLIALDSLGLLPLLYMEKNVAEKEACKSFMANVMENMCTSLQMWAIDLFKERNEQKEKVVIQYYFSVADWIAYIPQILEENPQLIQKLLHVVNIGLQVPSQVEAVPVQKESDKDNKSTLRRVKKLKDPEPTPTEPVEQKPSKPQSTVAGAARYVLSFLQNYYRNFPAIPGVEHMTALINESDDSGPEEGAVNYYVCNNEALFSVVEIPRADPAGSNNTKLARIVVRDSSGKYAWDVNVKETLDKGITIEDNCLIPVDIKNATKPVTIARQEVKPVALPPSGKVTLYDEVSGEQLNTDRLEELLVCLGEIDDIKSSIQRSLNQPELLPNQFLTDILSFQNGFLNQSKEDKDALEEIHKRSSQAIASTLFLKPPVASATLHNYHNCRRLLNQLGFLDITSNNFEDLRIIDTSRNFNLKLKNLDKGNAREMIKIGLLYIKNGQDDQQEILRNDSASDMYNEFVNGMGWLVNIANHKGYIGGLDPAGSNGKEALYFAAPSLEVAFHEVVRMPTNYDDGQQLLKKRHVGNDSVHIIWSEHGRDYSPKTVTSQFNDAHVIVYPLPNGLFRIQIAKKPKVPFFGPLIHGMTVSKRLLPILVRQTAINAYRYIRYTSEGYERPYFNRDHLIQEIIQKCSAPPDYRDFLKTPIMQQENKTFTTSSSLSPVSSPVPSRAAPTSS